jgi:hypothetical protein
MLVGIAAGGCIQAKRTLSAQLQHRRVAAPAVIGALGNATLFTNLGACALRLHVQEQEGELLLPDAALWIFLDYAQIARAENSGKGRTEELTFLSRQIKISAGTDLDGRGSWWANVQFNREADKALVASDPAGRSVRDSPLQIYNQYMLNGTGAFEQDSDVLADCRSRTFAHRADRHPRRMNSARGNPWSRLDIGFGKNRPTGMIVNTTCWMNMVNLAVVNQQFPIFQETSNG